MKSETMATELVSPGEETQIQTPEVVEPEVTTPEAETPDAEGEAKADDPAKAIERMQRRIDRKHAAAAKALAENAVLKQQLDELRSKPEKDGKPEDDVGQRAELIAEAKLYAKAADGIVAKGKTLAKDFIPALQDLAAEVGDFVQPNGLPSNFMRAVLDVSDSPTELLYHLGKNPDLAADLEGLPVTKLAARLDRIERELKDKATPKSSAAPKPIEPVKTKASEAGLHSGLSDAEWINRRERELRDRHR